MLKFDYDLSGKLLIAKLKVKPRASIGRGRQTRFSTATAPGTLVMLMQGTLRADNLRITGPSDGPHMSDHLEGKRSADTTTTSNTTAEASAKDAVVKRKSGSWSSSQVAYPGKDPCETVKTLRKSTHTFVGKLDKILDSLDSRLEVCNHSPSPKHFGGQKLPKNFLAG